jgi:hypothetical protein
VVTAGAKGCVVFAADPVTSYRGFLGVDDRYSHAHWLYQHNGGVFLPPWGKIEQWLISVQHDEADIDRLIENFAVFARAVGPGTGGKPMAQHWQPSRCPRRPSMREPLHARPCAPRRSKTRVPVLTECSVRNGRRRPRTPRTPRKR